MVRKKAVAPGQSLSQMFSEGMKVASERSNLWGYKPHSKQILFHKSKAKERLYVGGNRSGKTVGACVEDIYRLRGESPFQRVKPGPVAGRIVGVDFDNGVEKILKPMIQRWIPPSLLINGSWEDSYDKGLRILNCANGSTLEFMSYIQDIPKFAGTSRDFIHCDEEPPEGIYNECKLRTLDVGGVMYISMTPLDGMDWSYDRLYVPGTTGTNPRVEVIEVSVTDNPYVPTEEIDEFLAGFDDNEKQMRREGKFVHIGGMAFKKFGSHNIIPMDKVRIRDIRDWRWISSMDHGFNNPTAWLWHAISEDGRIITFHEQYQREWVVKQHADAIKKAEEEFGRSPDFRVGDPAIAQRNGETGHSIQTAYTNQGIYIALANNDVRSSVDRINDYIDPRRTKWFITDNCVNLINELKRARWKVADSAKVRAKQSPLEELVKKDDHAVDSARYLFSFMPDLAPIKVMQNFDKGKRFVESLISPGSSFDAGAGIVIDRNLARSELNDSEWTVIDEQMGGIF